MMVFSPLPHGGRGAGVRASGSIHDKSHVEPPRPHPQPLSRVAGEGSKARGESDQIFPNRSNATFSVSSFFAKQNRTTPDSLGSE